VCETLKLNGYQGNFGSFFDCSNIYSLTYLGQFMQFGNTVVFYNTAFSMICWN